MHYIVYDVGGWELWESTMSTYTHTQWQTVSKIFEFRVHFDNNINKVSHTVEYIGLI